MNKNQLSVIILFMFLWFTAISCKNEIITEIKYLDKVYTAAVTFDIKEINGDLVVFMNTATSGATIYYTSDQTEPNEHSKKYTDKLKITNDSIISAIAIKDGFEKSPVSYAKILLKEKIIITSNSNTDTTIPENITNFQITPEDSRVLLTWNDATEDDIFGYIVSYDGTTSINRTLFSTLDNKSMIVPKGAGGCYISGLTNGIEYTFIIKTIDTSGNISTGITLSAIPINTNNGNPLQIELTQEPPLKENNTESIKVNINIQTSSNVSKVVYKKNGTLVAKQLLADTEAITANETDNNFQWYFIISATDESANGTYTIAAIDALGREETETIIINAFDFDAPQSVSNLNGTYNSNSSEIILNWDNPSDYDHVEMTYRYHDGNGMSNIQEPIIISKNIKSKTINVNNSYKYYTFYFTTIDAIGNRSNECSKIIYITLPGGFIEMKAGSFTMGGPEEDSPVNEVTITKDFLICNHEVTQAEYEQYMTYYGNEVCGTLQGQKDSNSPLAPTAENGKGDDYAVYYINWYEAIIYCNLRSLHEGLQPVYYIRNNINNTDINNWINKLGVTKISKNQNGKFYYNSTQNDISILGLEDIGIKMNPNANGYRLPTEEEWEFAARAIGYSNSFLSTDIPLWAGTTSEEDASSFGWFNPAGHHSQEVMQKSANPVGLFDMCGNVEEWCWNKYNSNYAHVIRGGSFCWYAENCTITKRNMYGEYFRSWTVGFRVVRNVD